MPTPLRILNRTHFWLVRNIVCGFSVIEHKYLWMLREFRRKQWVCRCKFAKQTAKPNEVIG